MKKITFQFENKTYTLEYTRETVKWMLRRGFNLDDLTSKSLIVLPELFAGAFRANHKDVKFELAERMLYTFKDREKLFETLVKMFTKPINELLGEESDDEGNATAWEIV